MQPVTKEFIDSFCGIFKSKSGEKSAVLELLEDRAKARAREDRKLAAALAKHRNADLVTSDHEFKAVEKEIRIVWLK